MYKTLALCPVFKGLSASNIENILATVTFNVKQYSKEQILASRGQPVNNLIVLLDGHVRGEMLDVTGKILKVEDVYAPRPVAIGFLFGNNNNYPVDVVANTDVKALIIPAQSVIKLMQANKTVLQNILNTISDRAQFLSRRIWFLSFKTIKGKFAQYLLNIAQNNLNQIEMPLNQTDLAEFFGVTRPSLSRAINELVNGGIIKINRKQVTIINRQALTALVI